MSGSSSDVLRLPADGLSMHSEVLINSATKSYRPAFLRTGTVASLFRGRVLAHNALILLTASAWDDCGAGDRNQLNSVALKHT